VALLGLGAQCSAAAGGRAVLELLTAARKGDVERLKAALAAGAPVDAMDPSFGQTALIRAAMFGQPAAVSALLDAGARPEVAAAPDGRRALHWAALVGSTEAIAALTGAGAEIDCPDAYGETPLGIAVEAGAPTAVEALLRAGADPARMRKPLSHHIGMALGNGIGGERLDAIRIALRSGKGLEARSDPDGETALLAVAARSHRENADVLAREALAAGANPGATDRSGMTARQIVESRLANERNAAFRARSEAVLAALSGR
jgi:hypothetical protein